MAFIPMDAYNQINRQKMAELKPMLDELSAEARGFMQKGDSKSSRVVM
jgi:hypothetical protein